jgi:protein tyrosine/serine phosphatase
MLTRLSSIKYSVAMLISILTFSFISNAQTHVTSATKIRIKNFGKMDDRFYRGAQPKKEDYKDLAALGIKTIIDLRDDPKTYEKQEAENLGITYINIPMSDKKYPKEQQIKQLLEIMNDSKTGPFFVHCAGGRHRTGIAGAVYRFTNYGWDYDRVYKEMKNYDFYTRWGHGSMKDFVQDYWKRIQSSKQSPVKAE